MRVELVRDSAKESGAVTSKIYIDGSFFGYGLENAGYIFPEGNYSLYGKLSPSFGSKKIYIDVPGRSNIMFHGGNTINDVKGCIICAANRSGETVSGDLSGKLFELVDAAANNGEGVLLTVKKSNTTVFVAVAFVAALGVYLLTKKGRSKNG